MPGRKYFVHLICWSGFIFVEVVVAGAVRERFSSFPYYLFFYILNIGIFYFHGDVVMPFTRKQNLPGTICFLILFMAEMAVYLFGAMLVSIVLKDIFHETHTTPISLNFRYIGVILYRALYFMAPATGYFFLTEYLRKREEEMAQEVENERLRSQILLIQKDYLRAQINPHLFFNTLDFIKAVSKYHPERSDEAIDRLAKIMTYALSSSRQEFVSLKEELSQIRHIIKLNLLRSDGRLNLKFINETRSKSIMIIPIVLLTLVENVFKHGNLLDKNTPAIIKITSNESSLSFTTCNLIANTLPGKAEHTGLKNIQSRLNKSYPTKHRFQFWKDGDLFKTELTILLQ
jgi:sensor histidine kinase YesM